MYFIINNITIIIPTSSGAAEQRSSGASDIPTSGTSSSSGISNLTLLAL
jgi:hypothetical protein